MSKENIRNISERVLWTFIQGFLAYIILASQGTTDEIGWKGLLVGAVAAGISAIKNLLQTWLSTVK